MAELGSRFRRTDGSAYSSRYVADSAADRSSSKDTGPSGPKPSPTRTRTTPSSLEDLLLNACGAAGHHSKTRALCLREHASRNLWIELEQRLQVGAPLSDQ